MKVEELLAEAAWLRELAVRLAGDADAADDLVQETWMAAMRGAPERRESARPWLATVLRNAWRMRARSEGRRSAREQAAAVLGDEVPTPETLLERAEAQRMLADLVLRLDDPYRTTVLLHFGEGLSLADIARAQGIPASTVRWRLKTALDQLRDRLDATTGGRRHWALAFMAVPKGALVAHKSTKIAAAVVALVLMLAAGLFYILTADRGAEDEKAAGSRGGALTPDPLGSPSRGESDEAIPAWLIQAGVEQRRIAGRVTFDGAPVRGASVELASLASESGVAVAPRHTTNAAGEFDFGPRPATEWAVRASAPGKTGAAVSLDLRNPVARPAPDQLELELGPCEAALVGTVRDASGGAIAGARVARLAMGRSAVPGGAAVETDADGHYELCVVPRWPAGRASVEISADGYGAIVFTGYVIGRVEIDFALVPAAAIVGRVVRDETGEPLAKAHVFVASGPWGIERSAWRGTFTGDDGQFRIDEVAPGRHRVFARAEGMVETSRATPVVVEAGQISEELVIRLGAGSLVRGVVLEGGEPVAGARVATQALEGRSRSRVAVSQEDGTFVLEGVPRGEVRFTASPYDVVSPASFRVEKAEHDGVVLEVEALGAIVGQVVRGRRPVPGAFINIHGPNARELEPIRADADSRFEARGLRPGRWTLFAATERNDAFGRAPEIIQLARGATEEVTIELAYSAAIAGVVLDQDGAPVPGVSVAFQHTTLDDAGVAITSADGTFRAAMMIGGGQYRTAVKAHQGSSSLLPPAPGAELPLVTLADADSEITNLVIKVQLDRLSIAGAVVDTSGAPVADARVVATMVQAGEEPRFFRWVHHAAAVTDVEGRFSIADLSDGTYAVQARSPAGAEATATGVRAGRADVALTLPAPGAIEGTLVGFAGEPQVSATPTGGTSAAPTHGIVDGASFAFRDLSPGTYVVMAASSSEAASARVVVRAGSASRVTLTSGGSATVVGQVREFAAGDPVEGMSCRAIPRRGSDIPRPFPAAAVRSGADGRFVLSAAPAGDVVVFCGGLWHTHSDGLRMVTLAPSKRQEIDVPVVAWRDEVARTIGGIGAEIGGGALIPRLSRVREDGPAAAAGLRDGDRVVAVDGVSVTELSPGGIFVLIANRPPGTVVKVTAARAGKAFTGDLVLGEREMP
jgi:RNA polymerase sigma factor (sigma-70 family)